MAPNLYSYSRFSLSKSLANANKFLSLIDGYIALRSALPTPTIRTLNNCHLLAGLNIDYLTSANSTLNSTSTALPNPEVEQLQTLLFALLTNHQTCLDGLKDRDKYNAVVGVLTPSIVNGSKLNSLSIALFAEAWVSNRKSNKPPLTKRSAMVSHPTAMKC